MTKNKKEELYDTSNDIVLRLDEETRTWVIASKTRPNRVYKDSKKKNQYSKDNKDISISSILATKLRVPKLPL